MMKQAITACALAALAPAWAIHKCKEADGKTVFQDAPCAGQGEKIEVRPASGSAPRTGATPAAAKEGVFGEKWQRRSYLENRGVPDARAAIGNHQRQCESQQAALAGRKRLAANNLAGATLEQSISTEMQATATLCDSKSRELRAQLEALERELHALRAAP